MQKLAKNKGITLIALVITIIVLLILAGISMATLMGENGLIKRAQDAKVQTEVGREKEIISLAVMSSKMENENRKLEETEFRQALNETEGEGKTDLADTGEEFEVWFKESGRYYSVDKDGNVNEKEVIQDKNPGNIGIGSKGEELKGDENSPFEIWCIEDLVEWSKNSNKYVKANVVLGKNLDFKLMSSYADSSRTDYGDINLDGNVTSLIDEMQTGIGFSGISSFSGVFDGKKNEIKNIYINSEKTYTGFLNEIYGAEIKNFSISGEIKGKKSGGIVGRVASGGNKIINCTNLCNIEASGYTGGIVGEIISKGNKIVNCINYGNIYILENADFYVSCGGIVGNLGENRVINCCNFGNIKNDNVKVYAGAGGIVGNQVYYNITLENCFNQGKVTGKYSSGAMVGGFWYGNWVSNIIHSYYLEGTSGKAVGGEKGTEANIDATVETDDYMKSDEFLKDLNLYVEKYNKENKSNADFIELRKWVKGENGYPTILQ